ncbi:hypothetical protein ACWEFL_02880 [Streptomyces sp. NPDC004838]
MPIPGNMLSAVTERADPSVSGWWPLLNCFIAKGSGGRNGDGTLRLTSVAAGEMRARTVGAVPVTEYAEYQAFADASGATVPERIGIRWLAAGGAEISISWSMTTSSASASWHRIAVTDWAPAGAVTAQVVVSAMTPAGAGVVHHFENVYLGAPQRTTGNLLSASTETNERGGFWAWGVPVNASVARQMPPVSWAVDAYTAGAHVGALTVTANGDASCRSTDFPVVTPGVEYLAYLYLNPPGVGAACWVELRFYDAGYSQVQVTRAALTGPGTGWYRQRVSAFAPPSAAFATIALGVDGATAGQVLRWDGAVIVAAPSIRTGSVVPYADASYEQGVAGWTVVSGVATLARSAWGSGAEGSYSLIVSSATATASVIRSARFPLAPGSGPGFRAQVLTNVTSGGWTRSGGLRWYDAGGTDLGLTASTPSGVPTPDWWSLTSDHSAPAGAASVEVEWTLTATAPSSSLRVDAVAVWPALPLAQVDAVPSSAYITLTLRELDAGELLTVWRVTQDGRRTLVRGPGGLISGVPITTDLQVVEDYEAPLGVPVHYLIESRTPGSPLVETRRTATVTLEPGDPEYCWLKDPGRPHRNMQIMVGRAPDWTEPITQADHRVRGRTNAVTLSDVRGGPEGDLVLYTQTDDERDRLRLLLSSGAVLLWQTVPGRGEPDTYVSVGQVARPRAGGDAEDPWRVWTLPLRQADMPVAVGVAGSAGRTWQDILTENATWGDVLARFATWEDVFLNRPIGG